MEETISLKELLMTLKKRAKLITAITLLSVIASAIISYFILTPIYSASTQLLVNQSKNEDSVYSTNEVQTNLQLINTYNVIIKSNAILELVKEEMNLDLSISELNSKISVASEQDSQVVNITVEDESAKKAADIANKTAEVFQREIVDIMNIDNVTILSKASIGESPTPIKPQPLMNIAIALVVGLMLGVGLAFLLEYLDHTIKSEQDIEKLLGMPVLGVITVIDFKEENKAKKTSYSRARGEMNVPS